MKLLMVLTLVGYAVRCDDSNYYVVQMPYEDPPAQHRRLFRVYWNVPTMQCRSKNVPFDNLFEKFGIMQNKNDSFRGEKIAILYDPGLFPALLKNESTGEYKFRNGGVPQEGDLEKHLQVFRSVLEQSIPDEQFRGVGIIDFESWRPVFRQNFGVLMPYKDVSYEIERQRHWLWPNSWIQHEAKTRFEEKARAFMQTTLSVAKQMRPYAVWGYYGFPYCFNMATNNLQERCADRVPTENDNVYWLWSESSGLYPSVYGSSALTASQLSQMVSGRVKEAARVRKSSASILPYFWFRYLNKNGSFLSKLDLETALKALYQSAASGFIIWGSSNDVNTVDKCKKLLEYLNKYLGPAVAKYTNNDYKMHEEFNINTTSNVNNTSFETSDVNMTYTILSTTTTTLTPITDKETIEPFTIYESNTTVKPVNNNEPDPEYHWIPPDNYTESIVKYVEEEINKKIGNNMNDDGKNEFIQNNTILIDIILNVFDKYLESNNNSKSYKTETYSKDTTNDHTKTKEDMNTTINQIDIFSIYPALDESVTESSHLITTDDPAKNGDAKSTLSNISITTTTTTAPNNGIITNDTAFKLLLTSKTIDSKMTRNNNTIGKGSDEKTINDVVETDNNELKPLDNALVDLILNLIIGTIRNKSDLNTLINIVKSNDILKMFPKASELAQLSSQGNGSLDLSEFESLDKNLRTEVNNILTKIKSKTESSLIENENPITADMYSQDGYFDVTTLQNEKSNVIINDESNITVPPPASNLNLNIDKIILDLPPIMENVAPPSYSQDSEKFINNSTIDNETLEYEYETETMFDDGNYEYITEKSASLEINDSTPSDIEEVNDFMAAEKFAKMVFNEDRKTEESIILSEDKNTSTNFNDSSIENRTTHLIKNIKKGIPRRKLIRQVNLTESLVNSTLKQAAGTATRIGSPKFFLCIFLYYSISKCLCDYYGYCS